MSNLRNSIYFGSVFHERHRPFSHRFKYGVFTFFVDLDDLDHIAKKCRFFSFNRFNIISLFNKDHGPQDGTSLKKWIEDVAHKSGLNLQGGRIFMLFFPRKKK